MGFKDRFIDRFHGERHYPDDQDPAYTARPVPIKGYSGTSWWELPGWNIWGNQYSILPSGYLVYWPFYIARARRYSGIGAYVNATEAGKLVRLGIYQSSNEPLYPTSLLVDAGTISTTTGGVKTAAVNFTLPEGFYFLAMVADTTSATMPGCGSAAYIGWSVEGIYGHDINNAMAPNMILLYLNGRVADVAGGLANPAPTPVSEGSPAASYPYAMLKKA